MNEIKELVATNRLQEWRKKRKRSQQWLSDETGIPITTIQKIEKGHRDIASLRSISLLKLSIALNVKMEDVLLNDSEFANVRISE